MIKTTLADGRLALAEDQSEDLKVKFGEEVYQAVQAAMRAGFLEFTTPTRDDTETRIDWKVRRWFTFETNKLRCFLVAQIVSNEHYEVLGPEVDPSAGASPRDVSKK